MKVSAVRSFAYKSKLYKPGDEVEMTEEEALGRYAKDVKIGAKKAKKASNKKVKKASTK